MCDNGCRKRAIEAAYVWSPDLCTAPLDVVTGVGVSEQASNRKKWFTAQIQKQLWSAKPISGYMNKDSRLKLEKNKTSLIHQRHPPRTPNSVFKPLFQAVAMLFNTVSINSVCLHCKATECEKIQMRIIICIYANDLCLSFPASVHILSASPHISKKDGFDSSFLYCLNALWDNVTTICKSTFPQTHLTM